jgi:hypothetical protein
MQNSLIVHFFGLQKNFQVAVGQLVARLVFTVILVVFLDCVIGEMPIDVARVIVELLRTSSQVPFFVPICLQVPTIRCYERITSDVELSVLIEKRIDVLLN